jgi:hypothetical protein
MIPISRRKQVVGVVAIVACSYAVSWMFTPGPGTGPTESFGPTFGAPAAPVVIVPQESAPSSHEGTVQTSEPSDSASKPLQADRFEPI